MIYKMKPGFSFFLACILSLQVYAQPNTKEDQVIDYAEQEEYEVAEISVTGVKYLDQNVLAQLSGISVGDVISVPGDEITKAVKKYWEQGLFSDVKIRATRFEGDKVYLDIYLQERSRLNSINFKGIKSSEEKDLEEKVDLKRGSQVTQNILNNTKNIIQKHFVEKGFLDTEVNITQQYDSVYMNTVNLIVEVDKKDKVRVNDIVFENNDVFNDWQLRRAMKEIKRNKWYLFYKPSRFTKENLKTDKKKIIEKYHELGYRDVEITEDTVYRHDEKTVNIEMTISEGEQYYFGDFNWVGNTKYPAEYLEANLQIQPGDPYDPSLLEKRLYVDEDAVSNLYLNNGYLFFNISPVETEIKKDSVMLEMRIFEGEQATLDEVKIAGNTKTNEHVIRRELRTRPGELFRKNNITRSIRELANLGHFDPEKLDVKPQPDPATETVDLEYLVTEKANDQLEISGGWGAGMLVGTIGLRFNNFSARNIFNKEAWRPLPTGDGQTLSLRAQTSGKIYQSYNFSFVEPWLGGKKPNSFNVSVYHSKYTGVSSYYNRYNPYGYGYGIDQDEADKRFLKNTGMSIGLGRRLSWPDDYFTLYHELSMQQYNLKEWGGFLIENGKANHLNLKTQFGRNSVDQLIYPRTGSEFSLGLQITPPYSLVNDKNYSDPSMTDAEKYKWIEYHKWTFKGVWYKTLVENLVLATKTRFGWLAHYNDDLGPSPFEGFDLGGDGMYGYSWYGRDVIALRGYDDGTLTPIVNGNKSGNVFTKYSLELRYPAVLKPQATIYFLGFLEAGNCWYEFDDFNPFNVKRSAGVGLRAFLPMFGLLGIDWGYGFDTVYDSFGNPKPMDKSQFHFVIGQNF